MLKRTDPLTDPCGIPDSTLPKWLQWRVDFNSLDPVLKKAMNEFERLNIKTVSM